MNPRSSISPRGSAKSRQFAVLAGLVSDWIDLVGDGELDADTVQRLNDWRDYLNNDGPPPAPLPLNPTERQVDQAFRSFMRNAERASRTRSEARLHDLRSTVSELVAALTAQSTAIGTARSSVHELLLGIEADDQAELATQNIRTIRAVLRQLDEEAQRCRRHLNERLQELRTALLEHVLLAGRITDTTAELEAYFRALASAARLFGETITIIQFDVGDRPAAARYADVVRQTFRRDRDVVCVAGSTLTVLLMDTPMATAIRMIRSAFSSGEIAVEPTMRVVTNAEEYGSVEEALEHGG